jgi:hypothetical protein
LIDQHEHIVLLRNSCLPGCLDEPKCAAPQSDVEQHTDGGERFATCSEDIHLAERRCQIADRIFARRSIATRQFDPAFAISPLYSEGIRPERTSEDLPLPDEPVTSKKRSCVISEYFIDLLFAAEE